jgi:hypothetical protein
MAEYRVYLIDSDDRFYDVVPLICADDDEAMEKAKHLADGHDVELWQRDRKVARFDHKRTFLHDLGMKLDLLNCTQCETLMLEVARPLMRIFGDVRGFQCPGCNCMILEYSKRMVYAIGAGKQSRQQLDVASID